jgi:hypothetical protein
MLHVKRVVKTLRVISKTRSASCVLRVSSKLARQTLCVEQLVFELFAVEPMRVRQYAEQARCAQRFGGGQIRQTA